MQINKICFITYYSTCGHFCDRNQGVIQEYKQYTQIV